jgi:hypothetical protein
LEEMLPTPDQQAAFAQISHREPAAAGVLNFRGERLNESMELFGVKLTCALYYEHARRIIGTGEAVSVRIYTNADALDGKLPGELLAIMGENITLRQGRWSVAGQFEYTYVMTDAPVQGAFFSTFRRSFAVLGLVSLAS